MTNPPNATRPLNNTTPNLASSASIKKNTKKVLRSSLIIKKIKLLEKKIRSNYGVGDIKVRTTGKVRQFIWRKVDFLEFDKQWWSPMNIKSVKSKLDLRFFPESPFPQKRAIYQEGRGFLYCSYKCVGKKNIEKLILVEKHPVFLASRRSRNKIIKSLIMLSKILNCSKELEDISLLLRLFWQTKGKH